ncbi:MAG TPA: 16S rRNA (guanine(527)-N(7))-methyltransferase RsmG [Methylomirabilota bacterium]|jgi:16S rRNA (guanine527-N7)-methyltransferase|nr:16S rRNA (guanine(527)-N(7))-methyltransferase RsmG [Methylomirabilota bacterium]
MAGLDAERLLSAGIAALGIAVDPEFAVRVRGYLRELARWNRVSRLTGYREAADQVVHLVLESVMVLVTDPAPASPLLDIGSGAGAPGLILKLARPDWAITLVEANRRRANFLRHVVRELGLGQTAVEEDRAEALASAPRLVAAFRTVTIRAVAPVPVAARLAQPFLAPEGHAVLALGLRGSAGPGSVQEVTVADPGAGLRLRRRFLIIRAGEGSADVPRGTRGGRGAGPRGRESEGGRGQDHDRRESGRRPRERRVSHPPG